MRRGELILNAWPMAIVLVAWGGTVSLASGMLMLWLCLMLYAVGVTCLTIAKLPQIRRGHWCAFGPSGLSRHGRQCYRVAYTLLTIAALLNIGMLMANC